MKHIFKFLLFCFSLYGIEFVGEKITFNNSVNIQGNLFSQGPLVIESATLFQTITLNGSVNIATCTIGNTAEQTYLFLYGLKENLTPAFFLMIDPLTANLYKKQLTTTRSALTETNIFKTVLTNNISSNNNDVLKIENTNHSNKKINILFNASNLIIYGKTIFLNNLSSLNETIDLANDTSSINTINCNSITGKDITTQTITTILPTIWNATEIANINSLTAKEAICIAKKVIVNAAINQNNLLKIQSLPVSTGQEIYLTVDNNFISAVEENVGHITIKLPLNKYTNNFSLNCDKLLNMGLPPTDIINCKFKCKNLIIDEMNLSNNFTKLVMQYSNPPTQLEFTNLYINATNLISLKENNLLFITNMTTKNISNFQNTIKIAGPSTVDTANIYFSALKPLPNFTEYIVVSDEQIRGGNVGYILRTKIDSLKEYKTIFSLKELKDFDLLKSHEENLFFFILLRIKNLYTEIRTRKKEQEKNSLLLLKKIKKYTQLSIKQDNLCAKIKKKIKEIEKKIENMVPKNTLNEILEKLVRLNFKTNMDTIHE